MVRISFRIQAAKAGEMFLSRNSLETPKLKKVGKSHNLLSIKRTSIREMANPPKSWQQRGRRGKNLRISNSPQIWRSNQIYWAFVKYEIRISFDYSTLIRSLSNFFSHRLLSLTCLNCQPIRQSYASNISINILVSFRLLQAIDLSAFNDDYLYDTKLCDIIFIGISSDLFSFVFHSIRISVLFLNRR